MGELLDRDAVIKWLRQEAGYARNAQSNAKTETEKLYRMGQKDGLLLAAEAFERGVLRARSSGDQQSVDYRGGE